MNKLIILLLCCGVLIGMVGCGGNTTPPIESPPTTVSETVITETPLDTTPPVTAVEPTEKEKESVTTESEDQVTEPTVTTTEPTATTEPTEETKTAVTNTTEELVASTITETVPSTTPQLTEIETTATKPPKEEPKTEPIQEPTPDPETTPPKFDIHYWVTFTKEYDVSIGLILDSAAVDCWDNPIRAGVHCIYLERDIRSRLDRYAKDEDITDVWIWAEATGNDCYDIYIGYS